MYLMVFRQGQTTFSSTLTSIGGMYEDNLYLSNLYEFLEQPISLPKGKATQGLIPGDGIRFENVSFIYPGSNKLALNNVSFRIRAGEKLAIVGENGSGKTTLIKLLTRLYNPDKGRILLDGLDLQAWDLGVLQRRIGVIFQDFIRYQFTVGENIGVGDVNRIEDRDLWQVAADKGMALPLIEQLPDSFQTQLGKWFRGGQELSGGQWQKIALSRAFMRNKADILVLDEPTAAMDAEAEFQIFERLRSLTQNQMAILISHRFSTVRMADKIMVLSGGEVVEQGTHEELLQSGGRYAHLFRLQAAGYQ
jgi:ABC-type multidrug transport system fused ATPase/permease subunit